MIDIQNPWAGLVPYEVPDNAERKLIFCGRDDESYDLTQLIEKNILVTLYGKSGIGKTSLLNAGIFPGLSERQYIPFSIRLGVRDDINPQSYQSVILDTITRNVSKIETINVIDEQVNEHAVDFLWNYFARHRFFNEKGEQAVIVIVFDQFEEVFRDNNKRKEVEELLCQLDYINDKDHYIDTVRLDNNYYRYEHNFRFVISIREDDLFLLEDSIDNNYLPSFKRCRYHLSALSEDSARDVILIPGKECILPSEKESIVKIIIKNAIDNGDNGNGEISTNMLSLICNRIFVECSKNNQYISKDAVGDFFSQNPFERFYKEATNKLKETEKVYIENNLVDSTGRRNSVPESDFKLNVKNSNSLFSGENRILQIVSISSKSNRNRIELIHDSFCEPINKLKQKRLLHKKHRQLINLIGVSLMVILFAIGLYFILAAKNDLIQNNLEGMQMMQSRVVTKVAQDIKSPIKSLAMLMDVLPQDYNNPSRPYTQEAGSALINMLDTTRLEKVLQFKDEIFKIDVSGDESRLLVSSRSNIFVYDLNSMEILINIPCENKYINNVSFGTDASQIIFTTPDYLNVWDINSNSKIVHININIDERIAVSADRTKILNYDRWRNKQHFYKLYNVSTGELISEISLPVGHGYMYGDLPIFSADGSKLMFRSLSDRKSYIHIFDSSTGNILNTYCLKYNAIYAYGFCPDGNKVYISMDSNSGYGYELLIKDIILNEDVLSINVPMRVGSVVSVDFNHSGSQILVKTDGGGNVIIYDTYSGKEIRRFTHQYIYGQYHDVVKNIPLNDAFFVENNTVIITTNDRVSMWNRYNYDISIEGEGFFKHSRFIKKYNKMISSSSHDVCVWDMSTDFIMYEEYSINSDSTKIIPNYYYNDVFVYDSLTGQPIFELKGHRERVNSANFSNDGSRIITSSDDSTARVWDANTGKQLLCLVGHIGKVKSAVFSYDDKKILTTSRMDSTCRLWDAYTGNMLLMINHIRALKLSDIPWSARISTDGTKIGIVTSLYGSKVDHYGEMKRVDADRLYVFDAKSGNYIWSCNPDEYNSSIIFSSDGTKILMGNTDKRLLYDFNTLKLLREYENIEGNGELVFSSDEKEFIIYDGGEAIYRYKTQTGELLLKLDLSPYDEYRDYYIWERTDIQSAINRGKEILNGYKLSEEDRRNYYLD